MTLADRIVEKERELEALRQLQREHDAAAIARSVHPHVFSAAELLDHARYDAEVRDALHGATTPKQVGRRLARLAACEFANGIQIVCLPRNGAGCIWTVVLHAEAWSGADSGA